MKKIHINIPDHDYDVHIGSEVPPEIACFLNDSLSTNHIILISDSKLFELHGNALIKELENNHIKVDVLKFHSSEQLKTIETVTQFYDFALSHKIDRKTPVLAFGGGVTGDLVGFFAATYQRGIPFIQIPTTLLAMVDSSVGGKVAYNHPKGKNMIGAFYQPKAVFADTLYLETLPEREFACGIAECLKHGLLGDKDLFDWMINNAEAIKTKQADILSELISRNVGVKARIVTEDEKEQGTRALLNLGHTFGHAIEVTAGYGNVLHGEAVALGCIAAAYASKEMGHISQADVDLVKAAFEAFNLPVKTDLAPVSELIAATEHDKKAEGGKTKFILMKSIGDAYIEKDLNNDLVAAAFNFIRA